MCAHCGKTLEAGFLEQDGQPFCSATHARQAAKAKAKGQPAAPTAPAAPAAPAPASTATPATSVSGAAEGGEGGGRLAEVEEALAATKIAAALRQEQGVDEERRQIRDELFGNRRQLAHQFAADLAERPDLEELDEEEAEDFVNAMKEELEETLEDKDLYVPATIVTVRASRLPPASRGPTAGATGAAGAAAAIAAAIAAPAPAPAPKVSATAAANPKHMTMGQLTRKLAELGLQAPEGASKQDLQALLMEHME